MRFHGGTLSHPASKVNRLCPEGRPAYCCAMEPGSDHDKQRATQSTAQSTALADLARLQHESDALGGLFGRARGHFGAVDTPPSDRIELWGRRIGRTLSAVAFLALALYLYATYVR
jgi:hypothetical protein